MVAVLAFFGMAIPVPVLGQTNAGDVGIEKDDVKIDANTYSPNPKK
jgi:hypothetical protein